MQHVVTMKLGSTCTVLDKCSMEGQLNQDMNKVPGTYAG